MSPKLTRFTHLAAMEGFQVLTIEETLGTADIYVTATGNKDVSYFGTSEENERSIHCMQHRPFDNEIQVDRLQESDAAHLNIKPQVDNTHFGWQ